MKINCFINNKITNILYNLNTKGTLTNKDVINIYIRNIAHNNYIDTPEIFYTLKYYIHNYYVNDKNFSLEDDLIVNILFASTTLGKAINDFKLNGLTMYYNNEYHILLSSAPNNISMDIIIHEFTHIYIDNYYQNDRFCSLDELESEVEYQEKLFLRMMNFG